MLNCRIGRKEIGTASPRFLNIIWGLPLFVIVIIITIMGGGKMIATFCGHSRISQSEEVEKRLYTVTQRLIEQGITTFYLGGYGAFDSLAASVLRKQKKRYQQIELVLVLA